MVTTVATAVGEALAGGALAAAACTALVPRYGALPAHGWGRVVSGAVLAAFVVVTGLVAFGIGPVRFAGWLLAPLLAVGFRALRRRRGGRSWQITPGPPRGPYDTVEPGRRLVVVGAAAGPPPATGREPRHAGRGRFRVRYRGRRRRD